MVQNLENAQYESDIEFLDLYRKHKYAQNAQYESDIEFLDLFRKHKYALIRLTVHEL
jgi:hypothetical protein